MTTEWYLTEMKLNGSPRPPSQLNVRDRTAGVQDEGTRDVTGRSVEVQDGELPRAADTVIDRTAGVLNGMIPIVTGIETDTMVMTADQTVAVVVQIDIEQDAAETGVYRLSPETRHRNRNLCPINNLLDETSWQ